VYDVVPRPYRIADRRKARILLYRTVGGGGSYEIRDGNTEYPVYVYRVMVFGPRGVIGPKFVSGRLRVVERGLNGTRLARGRLEE